MRLRLRCGSSSALLLCTFGDAGGGVIVEEVSLSVSLTLLELELLLMFPNISSSDGNAMVLIVVVFMMTDRTQRKSEDQGST